MVNRLHAPCAETPDRSKRVSESTANHVDFPNRYAPVLGGSPARLPEHPQGHAVVQKQAEEVLVAQLDHLLQGRHVASALVHPLHDDEAAVEDLLVPPVVLNHALFRENVSNRLLL